VFYKFALVAGMIATAGCLVGYVFCIFSPNRGGVVWLAASAAGVALISVVLQVFFKVIPVVSFETAIYLDTWRIYDHLMFALVPIGGKAMDKLLGLAVDLVLAAPFILFSIYLMLAAKQCGYTELAARARVAIILLSCFAGAIVVVYIWAMVNDGLTTEWLIYIGWAIHWGLSGVLAFGLANYLKSAFQIRRALAAGPKSSGGYFSSPYGA
jgi:hypothetical protein